MNKRGIPFKEFDPTSDKSIYKDFQSLGGGNVVPVIKIGDSAVTEYTSKALDDALDAAGYPKPEAPEESDQADENEEPAEGGEPAEEDVNTEAEEAPPDEGR
jgi:hypothetical protein